MYYVIGSGLSGVACAHALLDRELPVTMIDVGRECEADIMERVRVLGSQTPDEWDPALVKQAQGEVLPAVLSSDPSAPTKFVYGSSFPYVRSEIFGLMQHNTKCVVSYARGGLSNVWGAAMLPCTDDDLREWPISFQEMVTHYESIAQFIDIAGMNDDLEDLFPFYALPKSAAPLSRQAAYLLEKMSLHRERLRARGFAFGRSRLVIRTEQNEDGLACQCCGQCLTGCPYMAIYDSTWTLKSLLKRTHFRYVPGLVVNRVQEVGDKVTIICQPIDSLEIVVLEGKRVFLACGPLSTVKVVVASLCLPRVDLVMQYQPYFLLPMWMTRNFAGVEQERLHTLAQVFIELTNHDISPYPVHLQIYTYNEMMRRQLRRTFFQFQPALKLAEKFILGRLIAVQGYLNSNCASGISLRATMEDKVKLSTSVQVDVETRRIINRVVRELLSNSAQIGAWPLLPMMKVGVPGDGNHIGAVFPMKRDPTNWESDIYGRVKGWRRIHVVDSSVLTSIPSPTITYTVMANAHRIASIVADMDR